jgi:hypothetical protein
MGYQVGKALQIKWKQSPLLMIHPSSRPIDLPASNANALVDVGLLIKHGKTCFQ